MEPARPPPARNAPPTGVHRLQPVLVVGLGASAGGLEALQSFFAHVPSAPGCAFVVVQHMNPSHRTLLVERLQSATTLPVHEAVDLQPLQADAVYVIPPDRELTVQAGTLRLARPAQPHGQRLPIDALFVSLAHAYGPKAIGVVLSGMGADGTLGLQAIKAQGGLTAVQEPTSAAFDSMPLTAVAAGCVDLIATPAALPALVLRVSSATALPWSRPAAAAKTSATHDAEGLMPAPDTVDGLQSVLALLHDHTHHDLSVYKSNTLVRRINRRVAVHGLASMAAYADFLRDNLQERELLFKEVLIGVTAFFRDPAVWQDLQHRVLPKLLAQHAADQGPLRAWVVACSTGEEAYSLAMAFMEVSEALPAAERRELQIFATDINADAIAAARSGRYAASIAQDLTPQRLARFFTAQPYGYQIDKRVRERVMFAQHDVAADPPFTRLDLLACRNLMIYFGSALQRRLIPLFHYTLRPGGVLLLGNSETVGRAPLLFQPLDPKSRVYWRCDNEGDPSPLVFPTPKRPTNRLALQENVPMHDPLPPANLQTLADRLLLQSHAPAAVLVNAGGDIVYVNGRTGRYLEPAAGKANWNIHAMAQPAFRAQLAGALRAALQNKTTVELQGLRLDDDSPAAVDITVQAVVQPKALAGMAMVIFRDRPAVRSHSRRGRGQPGDTADTERAELAEQLMHSRVEIDALRQEMRASLEELQAANEELQAANEELQSVNEELMTSKEEAQSMNEELQTINGELQSKLDDLALAQSDMQNLLNSTDIATLFLDDQLNVRRYTEQIVRVIHLREVDIGRPLSELASKLLYPDLHKDVRETLRTLTPSEKSIATSDGHWFTVRIMPYRTLANAIQGVVITFVDITVAKELESRLRKA